MNFGLEKIKAVFKKKPDYKKLYEESLTAGDNWEFKYNTLSRQLKAIIKESDS